MRAAGRGDVVTQLSDPLPALAICLLVGLPADDAPRLIPVVAAVDPLLDGVTDLEGMTAAVSAALRLHLYVQAKLDGALARQAAERAGLLGVLADAIDSGALSAVEALGILLQLFSAGTQTTSSLIANAIEIVAGRGLHFCIGEPLARLESRIALDPDLPPVRLRSILLRRHARLPVRLET
jgi:cytochrome P450